jgi:hypothetical protein
VARPIDAMTRTDTEQVGTRHISLLEKLPLPALALGSAALGVFALPLVDEAWRNLLGTGREPGPGPAELALSSALVLLVLALTWVFVRHGGRIRTAWAAPAQHWLHLERLAELLIARPVFTLATALARFDDRVIDGGVRATAATGRLASALAGRRVEIRVDGLVRAIGRGTRRLADLARRPQTGQAHTYYAQAAVLFAVLILIVLLVR